MAKTSPDDDRLALAEVCCRVQLELAEKDGLLAGTLFPSLDVSRCASQVEESLRVIDSLEQRERQLRLAIPDPEAVRAPDGSLPAQRRQAHLLLYVTARRRRVAELEDKLARSKAIQRDTGTTPAIRREAKGVAVSTQSSLSATLQEPSDADLKAEDLCPDALHLAASHGSPWPCPSWPGQQSIFADLEGLLDDLRQRRDPADLVRWELHLYCGHTVMREAHASYSSYERAASGVARDCEVCGFSPALVLASRLLGPAAAAPPELAPPAMTDAERRRLKRRSKKLEAELADLKSRLEDKAEHPSS